MKSVGEFSVVGGANVGGGEEDFDGGGYVGKD